MLGWGKENCLTGLCSRKSLWFTASTHPVKGVSLWTWTWVGQVFIHKIWKMTEGLWLLWNSGSGCKRGRHYVWEKTDAWVFQPNICTRAYCHSALSQIAPWYFGAACHTVPVCIILPPYNLAQKGSIYRVVKPSTVLGMLQLATLVTHCIWQQYPDPCISGSSPDKDSVHCLPSKLLQDSFNKWIRFHIGLKFNKIVIISTLPLPPDKFWFLRTHIHPQK